MTTQEKTTTTQVRRQPAKVYAAKEKAQAILSVWSGRRKPSAVSKAMGINWGILNMWEKLAITGILKSLGAEEQELTEQQGLSLGSRLERLLASPEKKEEPIVPKEA
jgi:hypothetical protein